MAFLLTLFVFVPFLLKVIAVRGADSGPAEYMVYPQIRRDISTNNILYEQLQIFAYNQEVRRSGSQRTTDFWLLNVT